MRAGYGSSLNSRFHKEDIVINYQIKWEKKHEHIIESMDIDRCSWTGLASPSIRAPEKKSKKDNDWRKQPF